MVETMTVEIPPAPLRPPSGAVVRKLQLRPGNPLTNTNAIIISRISSVIMPAPQMKVIAIF